MAYDPICILCYTVLALLGIDRDVLVAGSENDRNSYITYRLVNTISLQPLSLPLVGTYTTAWIAPCDVTDYKETL